MAISTIYDVRVRLMMTDKGSKALLGQLRKVQALRAEMQGATRDASRMSTGLGGSFGRIAALAGGAFGFSKAKEALIDFNSGLEQGRINIAGMLSQATGQEFGKSMSQATALVGKLQIRARDSIGTTEEMVQMAAMIARPLNAAGMGMKDLEDFTASAVVASKAFGIAPDMAARDIEAALMGQLRSVDRYSRALLESKAFGGKYVGEEGRARFNALSGAERASEYRKAQTTGGIADMAKAQGQTFAGVTSTLKDQLQIAAGKIGLPLFKAIGAEIKNWNKWIDANGAKIAEFSQKASQGLMEALRMAKSAAGFIVKHKDLLLALAKAWAAGKVVGVLTRGAADLGRMAMDIQKGVGAGFAGIAAKANVVVGALSIFAAALTGIASLIDSKQEKDINRNANKRQVEDLIREGVTGGRSGAFVYNELKRLGLLRTDSRGQMGLTPGAPINYSESGPGYSIGGDKMIEFKVLDLWLRKWQQESKAAAELGTMQALAKAIMTPPAAAATDAAGITKHDKAINVNIRNVEVATDDADRFVQQIASLAEDAIRNPSTARGSIRY